MNMRVRHESRYFITFINDYTRYSHVYLISHKFKALACFKRFITLTENQLDKKIKALRIDRDYEYLSNEFRQMYEEKNYLGS
jgi:hypothetical protein